jgi:hypothetical protein
MPTTPKHAMQPTAGRRSASLQFIRVLSLCGTVLLLWYLLVVPALDLKVKPPPAAAVSAEQRKLAEFDLEKKVYPEIQARILETNEWLFRKFTLAGGLLTGFLLQVWLRLRSKKPGEHTHDETVENVLFEFLRSPATSAVLGLACMVSLFIDLHMRSSILSIQQLGLWAAKYADVAVGGDPKGFPLWEQFIRMEQPNAGMHQSLINALQAENLAVVTIIIFVFYHWTFQEVCLRGLDQLNRLISWMLIGLLFLLFLGSHLSSGNVTFVTYKGLPMFSSWVCYLVAFLLLSTVTVLWHYLPRCTKSA